MTTQWRVANNGTGARIWFVVDEADPCHILSTPDGKYRRFGSARAARKALEKAAAQ